MVGNVNQEELMKSHVMHNLPGRLRLAASGLKYLKEQSGEIAAELARLPASVWRGSRPAPAAFCCNTTAICWTRTSLPSRLIWCSRGTR